MIATGKDEKKMILRNKKTGETGYLQNDWLVKKLRVVNTNNDTVGEYTSLADFNEEWEDYKDELFYVISAEHEGGYQCVLKEDYPEICEVAKELGIGFETEKECREAVEKLKAWKRLKDKGFQITGWDNSIGDDYYKSGQIVLNLNNVKNMEWDEYEQISEIKNDLDLLFGGKE